MGKNEKEYEPEHNFEICKTLSNIAYKNDPPPIINNDWIRINFIGHGSIKNGESIVSVYKNLNLACVAYKNIIQKEIIIAFRGTEQKDILDYVTDMHFIIKAVPKITPKLAKNAFELIKDNPEYKDYKFWFTGHSLGGAYAQILAADLVKNCYTSFNSITFNAPGLDYATQTEEETILNNIVNNYIIMNDFVGNFRAHVGNSRYFQPYPLNKCRKNDKGIMEKETPHGCILSYNKEEFGLYINHPKSFNARHAWALWIYDDKNKDRGLLFSIIDKILDLKIKAQDLTEAITIMKNITENIDSKDNMKLLNHFHFKSEADFYDLLSYEEICERDMKPTQKTLI